MAPPAARALATGAWAPVGQEEEIDDQTYMCPSLAIANGYAEASSHRDFLERQTTPEQISETEKPAHQRTHTQT